MSRNTIRGALAAAGVHPFPAIKPGCRLVPATIGRDRNSTTVVYIECPNWCIHDHLAERESNVEDIRHYGEMGGVEVLTFLDDDFSYSSWGARLEVDPAAGDARLREAHILVNEESSPEEARLTPDMAETLADELIGLASHLRHLARSARLHNQAQGGDSDPDMDEALRRVRAGGAA
ncbi:hypothetical protein KUM39_26275 [Streptomyces sp. J2-1]|uniref:DUF6907 domain-containing protein n=1 Tax=Streptomyces corallincola TaxID=2851888 RepID=UPI001C38BBB0|nr:hypothetical protein [Streptomyces corallincola]MBV2357821.1 hypothetical protein [Streptomyces corallincola]